MQGRWELIAESGKKVASLGVREVSITEKVAAARQHVADRLGPALRKLFVMCRRAGRVRMALDQDRLLGR